MPDAFSAASLVMLSDLLHPARTARVAGAVMADVPEACRQYRKAVRWAGIVCPAEVLWIPETATWVRRHGVAVAARSSAELSLAASAGIDASRMTLHCDGANAGPIRCGINAGVRLIVVESEWQAGVLAHYARRPLNVLVDVTAGPTAALVGAVVAMEGLNGVGLHACVDGPLGYADVIGGMVETMAQIRWETGTLMTRISLATTVGADPRRLGAAVEDALGEACARFRFPRPGVAVSLRWPVVRR